MNDVVGIAAPDPMIRHSVARIHFGPAIYFGTGGDADRFVARGWSDAEPGFRWMIGAESELTIERRFDDGDHLIELDVMPLLSPPRLMSQRLTIVVNGSVVGQSTVARMGPNRFGYRIPAAALAGKAAAHIVLRHPDAARPCDLGPGDDGRSLSLAVMRLKLSTLPSVLPGPRLAGKGGMTLAQVQPQLGMTPDQWMFNFESLGDTCEFGFVQRRCGAEPLSLLRYAGIDTQTLIHGVDTGFRDFGLPANIELRVEDKEPWEYIMLETRYGVAYHTFRRRDEVDAQQLLAREPARLAFLVRKLLEDMSDGNKIFVCRRNIALADDEILPLYAALNARGRNTLLWVVAAGAGDTAGTVEVVMPGLLKGYVERLAPHTVAEDLSLESWLEVCANAWRLSRTHERA